MCLKGTTSLSPVDRTTETRVSPVLLWTWTDRQMTYLAWVVLFFWDPGDGTQPHSYGASALLLSYIFNLIKVELRSH